MLHRKGALLFLAETKQLYDGIFCPSVRPSVCPSVRLSARLSHLFDLCSHHRIIMKFSGVITKVQGKVHAKGQCQRSNVKVTEVTTQLTVPDWNSSLNSHMMMKWCIYLGCCLGEVPYCFSRSSVKCQGRMALKNHQIWPKLGVTGL